MTCIIDPPCLVVDQALEVVEEYQKRILKLEKAVLLKPSMKHVRRCMLFLLVWATEER